MCHLDMNVKIVSAAMSDNRRFDSVDELQGWQSLVTIKICTGTP